MIKMKKLREWDIFKKERTYKNWVEDEVCKMSKDDFICGFAKGFKYDNRQKAEASYHINYITVGNNFFEISNIMKKNVLFHEEGHGFADEIMDNPKNFVLIFNSNVFNSFKNERNIGEMLAESYRLYQLHPKFLKEKHQKAFLFVQNIFKGKSVEESVLIAKKPIKK